MDFDPRAPCWSFLERGLRESSAWLPPYWREQVDLLSLPSRCYERMSGLRSPMLRITFENPQTGGTQPSAKRWNAGSDGSRMYDNAKTGHT